MNKKLTAVGAAMLVLGFAAPAHSYEKILYGTVIEAEKGVRYCGRDLGAKHTIANHPDIAKSRLASGGKYVTNFTALNYVEHKAKTDYGGFFTAYIYYATQFPTAQISFQVDGLLPSITPPLVASIDPRFNPNPWAVQFIAVPLQVYLPPGKFHFKVRNVTWSSPINWGDTHFDYDRIIFGAPLPPPTPWPWCFDPDVCQPPTYTQ
jgi:hypothetical protein